MIHLSDHVSIAVFSSQASAGECAVSNVGLEPEAVGPVLYFYYRESAVGIEYNGRDLFGSWMSYQQRDRHTGAT